MKFKRLFLLEAFSSSMPKWLQQYVIYNPKVRNYSRSGFGKYADPNKRNLAYSSSRNTGRDKKSGTAADIIWGKGNSPTGAAIDFSRANFITQEVPKKVDDPIFLDKSKMCFVHLDSGFDETVWIPGFSSPTEQFAIDDYKKIVTGKINSKQLREFGKDFCYLDLTDSSNFITDITNNRVDAKSGSIERISQNELNDMPYWRRSDFDKSGYRKIPSADRYAKKLRSLKIKKVPQLIIDTRERLVKLQKDLAECSSQYASSQLADMREFNTSDLKSAYNAFIGAADDFQDALTHIDRLTMSQDEDSRDYQIKHILRFLKSVDENINSSYNYINHYLPASIDWNRDDDSIFVDVEDDFE